MDNVEKLKSRELDHQNASVLRGYTTLVVVLIIAYLFEVIKGERSIEYYALFCAVATIPCIISILLHRSGKVAKAMPIIMVACYFVLFCFVLATGATRFVFCYILPFACVLTMYGDTKKIMIVAVPSVAVTLAFEIKYLLEHPGTPHRETEIIIACQVLVFLFSYLAAQAISRNHARVYREMEKSEKQQKTIAAMNLEMIVSLVRLIDEKDEFRQGHSSRVAYISTELARTMGYSVTACEDVRIAAYLHDIGKVGIPDILFSKVQLTEEERMSIYDHATKGADILEQSKLPQYIVEAARYHHERYDGSGYPRGLKGNEIPEIARIIGVADAFDAMLSRRSYRSAMTKQQALHEIINGKGTSFDPDIADNMVKIAMSSKFEQSMTGVAGNREAPEFKDSLISTVIQEEMLLRQKESSIDYLTGLWNRMASEKMITEALVFSDGTMLLFDVDNFKQVNDKYGHQVGDEALRLISELLADVFKGYTVGRMGGDEFICFMSGVTEQKEIIPKLEEVIEGYGELVSQNQFLEKTSLSIGVVISNEKLHEFKTLWEASDQALYKTKAQGKNGYAFASNEDTTSLDAESVKELETIVSILEKTPVSRGALMVELRDLSRNFAQARAYAQRYNLGLHFVTFTTHCPKEKNDKAMEALAWACTHALRSVDVASRLSEVQYAVILVGAGSGNVEQICDRINKLFTEYNPDEEMKLSREVISLEHTVKR